MMREINSKRIKWERERDRYEEIKKCVEFEMIWRV
jgi:hypothetical protein